MADNRSRRPAVPKVTGLDGRKVSINDLPLTAYALACGHVGRDYGVLKGDLIFCGTCQTPKRVSRVIA